MPSRDAFTHHTAAVFGGLLMNQQARDRTAAQAGWPCARGRTHLIHFNASGKARVSCHPLPMNLPIGVIPLGNPLQISC